MILSLSQQHYIFILSIFYWYYIPILSIFFSIFLYLYEFNIKVHHFIISLKVHDKKKNDDRRQNILNVNIIYIINILKLFKKNKRIVFIIYLNQYPYFSIDHYVTLGSWYFYQYRYFKLWFIYVTCTNKFLITILSF